MAGAFTNLIQAFPLCGDRKVCKRAVLVRHRRLDQTGLQDGEDVCRTRLLPLPMPPSLWSFPGPTGLALRANPISECTCVCVCPTAGHIGYVLFFVGACIHDGDTFFSFICFICPSSPSSSFFSSPGHTSSAPPAPLQQASQLSWGGV